MKSALPRFLARQISQILPHLAIFAMMLLAFAPSQAAFWQCEGKICGDSEWNCCCESPVDKQDANCQSDPHFADGEHLLETGLCALDCHCTMVVQGKTPTRSTAAISFATPPFFVAPMIFTLDLAAPIAPQIRGSQPSRGPPSSVFRAANSLRGPPFS